MLGAWLVAAPLVQAATRTWDGGGADNNWSTAANWSSNLVPGAADTAVFNATSTKDATIDVAASVLGVSINMGYTGTITQAAGAPLTVGGSNFSQSAGTFVGGSSAITVNGSFTVNTGSAFTATTGTLTVTGAVTLAASVFTHNGGTVAFSTSNVTLNLGGGATFNNVQFVSGTKTISAGNTMTVLGTLTLTGGAVNTGTLAAQGDIAAASAFTGGGTATLLINGGGAQAFSDAALATSNLPLVNIDKPSGTLTLSGTFRTTRNWTYTAGGLTATGSTVIFAGTQTITGSHTLDAVELRGGTVTIAAATTLTATGTLTLTDGNLNGGTLEALGDIVLVATYDGETGTVRIAGVADQTLTGSANATSSDVANIVIDKPSGTLHLVGTVRLVSSSWTWLNGTIDAGTSTIYFDSTVTITGTHSLYNVYLSGGAHTVAGGDTLTALGTLTLDNGTISGGTMAAAGDITQLSTFNGGTGRLAIIGAADQTFIGSATTTAGTLPDLEINKVGGTLTLSGTIRTTRDWTHLAGAVDPDSSTVVLAGTLSVDAGGMAYADLLVTAGTAMLADDLTAADLAVTAGTLAIGPYAVLASGDVTVDGGLTVTTGMLVMNGLTGQTLGGAAAIGLHDLTISDPAGVIQTTSVAVAGTLDLGGPLTFAGQSLTITHAITGAPDSLAGDALSTLIISGTGSGIVIPSSLASLLDLAITNANGAALAGPLTVMGTLTLGGGNLDAGSDVLSIGTAGGVNRTAGQVIGALQKWVPIGLGVSLTFEIGDAATYTPISATFGAVWVNGQLTASTMPGEHPSVATSPIDPAADVNRWWTLINAGVAFDTVDATFTFAPADLDAPAQTGQFIVVKWDGSWATPASGGNTATTITASGMSSFSEFAVGEPAADLTVSKDGPASAIAGDPAGIDYVLTVHNGGLADNSGGFTISDALPAGLTFQPLGSDDRCAAVGQDVTCVNAIGLAIGAADAFVLHATLDSTVDAGTILSNAAVVTSAGTNDPDSTNNSSATVTTTVLENVQLGVTKAFGSAAVTAGGQSETFSITVTNGGDSDADNLVVTDTIDDRLSVDLITQGAFDCSASSGQGLVCALPHLAAGASQSIGVTYHVAATAGAATVANTAIATSDEDDNIGVASVEVRTSGSVADTSASEFVGQAWPAVLLLALAGWTILLATPRLNPSRGRSVRR
ncbi:MAG TPA: hypothetical protein VJA85_01370 [Candidatus Limnocylindria bacterium]|nr:hypothetical protein [Candidatus Limnocylindria bacterium]